MLKNWKKVIAPVVITVVIAAYYIGLILLLSTLSLPLGWLIAAIVIPLCLLGVSIYVLVERIKEIRSGEEDDLSQY